MQAIVKEVLHLTTLSAKDFPPSLIQRALAAQQSRGISRALGFRALDACWAALQQLESIPASDVSYPNLELALCLLLHPVAAAFSRHAQAAYPPLLESAPGHPQGGLQLAGRALAAVAWQGVAGFIARASACKILAKSDSAALSAMGTLAFDVNPADVQPLAEAPLFEWLTPYIAFPGSGPMLLSGPTIGVDEDEAAAREHVRRMGSSPARAAAFPVRLCAWALFRLFAGVAAQGPQGPMAKAMAKFLYLELLAVRVTCVWGGVGRSRRGDDVHLGMSFVLAKVCKQGAASEPLPEDAPETQAEALAAFGVPAVLTGADEAGAVRAVTAVAAATPPAGSSGSAALVSAEKKTVEKEVNSEEAAGREASEEEESAESSQAEGDSNNDSAAEEESEYESGSEQESQSEEEDPSASDSDVPAISSMFDSTPSPSAPQPTHAGSVLFHPAAQPLTAGLLCCSTGPSILPYRTDRCVREASDPCEAPNPPGPVSGGSVPSVRRVPCDE
jgi:hypothetical protein